MSGFVLFVFTISSYKIEISIVSGFLKYDISKWLYVCLGARYLSWIYAVLDLIFYRTFLVTHFYHRQVMAYVVTEACINCKYTNCAAVCPVEAFREGPNFLVIDPNECIDCDACVSECPVEAIYPDDEVPGEMEHYIEWNERLAGQWEDHVISETKDAMPDADEWKDRSKSVDDILEW